MDANITSLNWERLDQMTSSEYDHQFMPLVGALFDRILSMGITMVIKQATRSWQGAATRCLDHIYTSEPNKMGDSEVVWTGLSDHALVKVKRYTKSLEKRPRYIKKRCFKKFDRTVYLQMVQNLPDLGLVINSNCPNKAAELLTKGLTRVLDLLAPLRSIQVRNKYAPWLSEETKDLTRRRREAQANAATTGDPGDLRQVRSLRNMAVKQGRKEREVWERDKLESRGRSPSQIWAGVKSVLGWGNNGPPTRLYHGGKYIDTPKGLATV